MEGECFSFFQLALQSVCAMVSVAQFSKLKSYMAGLYKEDMEVGHNNKLRTITPRLCVVVSGSDKSVAINILRARGFTVMSVVTEKKQENEYQDYTILAKVGPRLFPKLAVGLNLPLQPTAMYSQGELYRIYETALVSIQRARTINVSKCYLQHDLPVLNKCLKNGKTVDVIDYFGLEFGLMFEFVSSYQKNLTPIALFALILKGILIYQYLMDNTCPIQSSFLFPALVAFWSIVSLTFWRQKAMALISAAYSGLMLSLIRGSTSSLVSIRTDQLIKLVACIGVIAFFAVCYIFFLDILLQHNFHIVWQYALGAVYSIIPPLGSRGMIIFLKGASKDVFKNKTDKDEAPKNVVSSPATSGIFALEIINHHGALFFLHFWRNDYQTVRLLLLCKLLCEQILDIFNHHILDQKLRQKREVSADSYHIEEITDSIPTGNSHSRLRKNSNTFTNDNINLRGHSNPGTHDMSPLLVPSVGGKVEASAGDHLQGKKLNAAKRFLRKITGKKKEGQLHVDDDCSEATDSPDVYIDSIHGSETHHAQTEAMALLRSGLEIDVDVKPKAISTNNQFDSSQFPSYLTPKSNQVFCMEDLMTEFLQHPTFEEFHLTAAYAKLLVLHGYLVLFSAISPLSIILILLQLRHVIKMNLVRASNSVRTNHYANHINSYSNQEDTLPESLSKTIAKAKAEDNPHPTTSAKVKETHERSESDERSATHEESGTQLAENMLKAAAYSIRSDSLFCFYINVINVVAVFTNAIYVFHSGLPSTISILETICSNNSTGNGLQGEAEVVMVCNIFMSYVKCTCIVFLLLGIKLMIDTFVNDVPNYLSDSYMKSVTGQFTQALKYRLIQFQKRSTAAREMEALGKALYSANIKLQHELANVKLQKIYAKCEKHGNSIVFGTLTLLPIIGHVFLQLSWSGRQYQNAALEVISDHNLLNLIREAMPLWTHHDSEPCGWVNDAMGQCWDQMNVFAVKKAREKFEGILNRICPPMLKRMGIRKMGLGDTPPTIHSIRVFSQDSNKTKMEMEVDVTWVSECFMQLEIVNHGGAELLFEICNFTFSGTLRVQCTPLVAGVPPFEYARITFVKPPVFDFSLRIGDGGGFDFVDPIAKAVQRVLKRAMSTIALYPKWINILIDEKKKKAMDAAQLADYEAEMFALEPTGVLTLSIEGCNNLPIADITSSDPFIEIHFMEETHKTTVVYRSLNPRWSNECFDLLVYDLDAQSLNLSVWDYDLGAINDDFLGEVDIPLSTLSPNVLKSLEIPLRDGNENGKPCGTVMLSMAYIPLRAKPVGCKQEEDQLTGDDDILFNVDVDTVDYDEMSGNVKLASNYAKRRGSMSTPVTIDYSPMPVASPENLSLMGASATSLVSNISDDDEDDLFALIDINQDHPVTGALLISNICCQRLAHGDEKCDPYVTLSMGAVKRKTKVIKSSVNPIFGESFTFVVRDPLKASFTMKVKNNRKKVFGHTISGKVSNGYVKFSILDIYPFLLSDMAQSASCYGTRKMEFELAGGKKGATMGSISFTVKHICA